MVILWFPFRVVTWWFPCRVVILWFPCRVVTWWFPCRVVTCWFLHSVVSRWSTCRVVFWSVRCGVVMVEVECTVPRTWRREASPRSCSSRPRRQWSSSWDKCSRSSRWSLPCPCTSSSSSSSPHSRQLLSPSCPPRWQQLQLSPLSCSPPRKSTSRSSLLLERCRAYRWVQVQVPKDLTARERSAEEKQ